MILSLKDQSTLGLMTVVETSLFLNLKVSRIRSLIFKNEIPFHKLGSTVFFIKSELEIWAFNLKGGLNE
jgi:excisionase family DNA binding protein